MLEIAGYEIDRKIFTSSRSVVYAGRRLSDQRPVIIKAAASPAPTPMQIARFRKEYEVGRQLDHPHIIKYLAIEPLPRGLALIEEDIEALGLRDLIPEKGFEIKRFLEYAVQLADGLSAIHRRDIIHKDLKPSNIVVAGDLLKIIDFGISSQLDHEHPEMELASGLEGTLVYMSPEQTGRMNRDLDYRSDFYSLGITFYEMLTGHPAFRTSDSLELIHCHIAKKPTPPNEVRPEIPSPISQIVLKMLEKNAEDRYQSSFGLIADLKWCLKELNFHGKVQPFPIGLQDVSDKFRIPQKLYGRDKELTNLLETFERTCNGSVELLLVNGYAGVGKSRLFKEVRRPITQRKGYMVTGKFDRMEQEVAYSAMVRAFGELIRQILGETEDIVAQRRATLLEALEDNGQIIIDLIPELAHLIGDQPPVPALGPRENRFRFNKVFGKFVSVIAGHDHPLVLFLDDLQWADEASLRLLQQLLTNKGIGYFLLLGSYRDNEIEAGHRLPAALEHFRKKDIEMSEIHLEPLGEVEILALIRDTLDRDSEYAGPLARLVMRKTHGNPYFVNELLYNLFREGFLYFDYDHGHWDWDVDKIRATKISDDVVSLVLRRLEKLPEQTRSILEYAACIGNRFDLKSLSLIVNQTMRQVATALWPAVVEGVAVPVTGDYQTAHLDVTTGGGESLEPGDIVYHFPHDRVQEAAYALIKEDQRKERHLKIGRILLNQFGDQEERIFEIVHQLNDGMDLISERQEKQTLLELNLMAARRANASTASRPALMHLARCIKLLPEDAWERQYQRAYEVYRQYAHTAYLCREQELAGETTSLLLEKARTNLEKADILLVNVNQWFLMGKVREAMEAGLHALSLLGVKLPLNPGVPRLLWEGFALRIRLLGKSVTNLANRPRIEDHRTLTIMRHLIALVTPAYTLGYQNLFALSVLTNLKFALKEGNSPESSHAFISYGTLLSAGLGSAREGDRYARLGYKLNNYYGDRTLRCKVAFGRAYTSVWTRHWRHYVAGLEEAVAAGLEVGDVMYTAYAAIGIAYWDPDRNLTAALEKSRHYMSLVDGTRFRDAIIACRIHHQLMLNFTGRTTHKLTLGDDTFQEQTCIREMEAHSHGPVWVYYHFARMRMFFYYDHYEQALEELVLMEEKLDLLKAQIYEVEYCLFAFLTRAALFHERSPEEQKHWTGIMKRLMKSMGRWRANCPSNFEHLELLMKAERARLKGSEEKAARFYQAAYDATRHNDYPRYRPLVREYTARFYHALGAVRIAAQHMAEAYDMYVGWGAEAKIRDLEKKYGKDLLAQKLATHLADSAFRTTGGAEGYKGLASRVHSSGTEGGRMHGLDLDSVTSGTREISQEMDLEPLLKRILTVMITSTSVQRGFLILDSATGPLIQAERDTEETEISVLEAQPLAERRNISRSIVRYVFRTGENVVLHNAAREGPFTRSLYVLKNKPKSVACMPIRHKDRMIGALYLENNLISGAFTEDRIRMLYILLSQAAISLDNARLYEDARKSEEDILRLNQELERRVAERTAQLEATRKALVERAHHAGMADIATAVLHNVGNILNSVITSSEMILDRARKGRLQGLSNARELLLMNMDQLDVFMAPDGKGPKLIEYLLKFDKIVDSEHQLILDNVDRLMEKTQAIKQAVVSQQSYAAGSSRSEKVPLPDLVEDALSILESVLSQDNIEVERHYGETPPIVVHKAKLVHIIISITRNAVEAMSDSLIKQLRIDIDCDETRIFARFTDYGCGISKENLEKIFEYGFTTRSNGRGFGLYGSANSMKEMGGSIDVESKGAGQGATFVLAFPRSVTV